MHLRRSALLKYFLLGVVVIAVYCEWLIYVIQPLNWHELRCREEDESCTKILYVADPQIQGEGDVPPLFTGIVNWDSDKFLKSTFSVVLRYFEPDVIVYLGDLMDKGSVAELSEYHSYVKRLADIFTIDYPVTQVWLPGDNDIGGEGEPIYKDKVTEFEKTFKQPQVVTHKNISFYKVNGITYKYPGQTTPIEKSNNLKIVVSHYPVTEKHSFGEMVNNAIRPNIYFCAHDHESKYVVQDPHLALRETHPLLFGHPVLNISFKQKNLYEIYVPTCSYRMGTSKIGFGAAVIENNNQVMRYTVFWSPQRFPYLIFYLAFLLIIFIYLIIFCSAKLFFRRSERVTTMSEDKVPFLDRI